MRSDERARSIAFHSVVQFCTARDKVVALAGEFKLQGEKKDKLVFQKHPDRPKRESPVTRATDYIIEEPDLMKFFEKPEPESEEDRRKRVMNCCYYWFKVVACQPERKGFGNKPRAAAGKKGPSDADLEWLGNALVTRVYTDGEGNKRRYASLETMLRDAEIIRDDEEQSDEVRKSSGEVFDRLALIKATAGDSVRGLDKLLPDVCTKCGCVLRPAHSCVSP